jgi:hypothetical protein
MLDKQRTAVGDAVTELSGSWRERRMHVLGTTHEQQAAAGGTAGWCPE